MKKCADRKAFQRTSTEREIPGKHCLQGLNWTIDKISSSGNTKTTKKWYSQDFYRLINGQVLCITCNSCLTIFFGCQDSGAFAERAKKKSVCPWRKPFRGKRTVTAGYGRQGCCGLSGRRGQEAPGSRRRPLAVSGGSSSICRIGPRGIRGTYRQIWRDRPRRRWGR